MGKSAVIQTSATAAEVSASRAWSPRRQSWLAIAIIVIGTFATYANSLQAPFIFDDLPSITDNVTIRRLSDLGAVLSPPNHGEGVTGRPLVNLSLAIDYAIWSTTPWGFRLTNIAIHALAALVLFGLVRRTLARPIFGDAIRKAAIPLAASVALIWALHPLQTETVVCIIQRTESLVSLLYLLCLYGLARAVPDSAESSAPASKPTPSASRRWMFVSIAACFAGMASKEVMVSAPVIAFLYDRTFIAGSFAKAWRSRWRFYLGLASAWLLLGWLVIRSGGTRGGTSGFNADVTSFDYLLTQARAITLYLKLAFWPDPLVVDYGSTVVRHVSEVALRMAFIASLVIGTICALRWRPVLGFVGAFFFAILAPSSSVVPLITQTIAEHRMYLPLASVVALVAFVMWRLGPRVLLAGTIAIAIAGALLTVRRNADYGSDLTLWLDAVRNFPASARAHASLGTAYYMRNQLTDAAHEYEESLRLDANSPQTRYNLGLALEKLGRINEAVAQYEQALKDLPDYTLAYASLGIALNKAGRYREALENIEQALARLPKTPAWHCVRGAALTGLGRVSEAMAEYRAALKIAPDFAEAEANLGEAMIRQGNIREALPHLERALKLDPKLADVHFNLGQAAAALGQRAEATAHYADAVRIDPAHFKAQLNLGVSLAQSGALADALTHLEAAVKLNPSSAEAHANLGIALSESARPDEAVAAFEQALALRPDYVAAHYNLGNTLVKLGRYADAKKEFLAANRLDPQFAPAREMLERMQDVP